MRTDEEGRCYLDHIAAQHRRLHARLQQIRVAEFESVQPDESPIFAEVAQNLRALRQEVASHFSEEEAGGCLDEGVSRCPSLSGDYHQIETEHTGILEQIDGLIKQVETASLSPPNQGAIPRQFTELCSRLLAHEAAENRLLSQAFGTAVTEDESARKLLEH